MYTKGVNGWSPAASGEVMVQIVAKNRAALIRNVCKVLQLCEIFTLFSAARAAAAAADFTLPLSLTSDSKT